MKFSNHQRANPARSWAAYRRRATSRSFTLLETVIALAIMAFLIIEVSAVQGNSIYFSDYSRNVTQATWLAKEVLSQVEYFWKTKPFPDMANNTPGVPFKAFPEYQYSLDIKEWKFPFEQLLLGNFGGSEEEEGDSDEETENPLSAMIEQVVSQVFGEEPQFMTANVQVCWSEGATNNCTQLTHLLTNQKKIDEAIIALKPVYDKLTRAPETLRNQPNSGPGPVPGPDSGPGPGEGPDADPQRRTGPGGDGG